MILITLFDKKSSSYLPPLCYDHISQAIRAYIGFALQKPDASHIRFAEDFDLYDVGSFDVVSGVVTPTIPPEFVESMLHIVSQSRKEVSNG